MSSLFENLKYERDVAAEEQLYGISRTKKINELKERGNFKLNNYANLEDSYTETSYGVFESNRNKVWNDLDSDEYKALYDYAVQNYGLGKDERGYYNKNTGDRYLGRTTNLYGFNTKDGEGYKVGLSRGDKLPYERYNNPNYTYGEDGVDNFRLRDNVLLPEHIGRQLESLAHGRKSILSQRLVPDMSNLEDRERYGSGASEYYRSRASVFGNSLLSDDNTALSNEEASQYLLKNLSTYLPQQQGYYRGAGSNTVKNYWQGGFSEYTTGDNIAVRAAKATGAMLGKTLLQIPDALVEMAGEVTENKDWDLWESDEIETMVNDFVGYNPKLYEDTMDSIKDDWKIVTDYNKEDKERAKAALSIAWKGLTSPEFLGSSTGYVLSLYSPSKGLQFLAKGGKGFKKIDQKVRRGEITPYEALGEKTLAAFTSLDDMKHVMAGQAGQLLVASGQLNEQYEAWLEANDNEDLTLEEKTEWMLSRLPVQLLNQNLEKIVSANLFSTGSGFKTLGPAIKNMTSKEAGNFFSSFGRNLGHTLKERVKGSVPGALEEATQEYIQTGLELWNTYGGSKKFKDKGNFVSFITDNEIQNEMMLGGLLGTAGSLQFQGLGLGKDLVMSPFRTIADRSIEKKVRAAINSDGKEKDEAITTEEQKEKLNEKIKDNLIVITRGKAALEEDTDELEAVEKSDTKETDDDKEVASKDPLVLLSGIDDENGALNQRILGDGKKRKGLILKTTIEKLDELEETVNLIEYAIEEGIYKPEEGENADETIRNLNKLETSLRIQFNKRATEEANTEEKKSGLIEKETTQKQGNYFKYTIKGANAMSWALDTVEHWSKLDANDPNKDKLQNFFEQYAEAFNIPIFRFTKNPDKIKQRAQFADAWRVYRESLGDVDRSASDYRRKLNRLLHLSNFRQTDKDSAEALFTGLSNFQNSQINRKGIMEEAVKEAKRRFDRKERPENNKYELKKMEFESYDDAYIMLDENGNLHASTKNLIKSIGDTIEYNNALMEKHRNFIAKVTNNPELATEWSKKFTAKSKSQEGKKKEREEFDKFFNKIKTLKATKVIIDETPEDTKKNKKYNASAAANAFKQVNKNRVNTSEYNKDDIVFVHTTRQGKIPAGSEIGNNIKKALESGAVVYIDNNKVKPGKNMRAYEASTAKVTTFIKTLNKNDDKYIIIDTEYQNKKEFKGGGKYTVVINKELQKDLHEAYEAKKEQVDLNNKFLTNVFALLDFDKHYPDGTNTAQINEDGHVVDENGEVIQKVYPPIEKYYLDEVWEELVKIKGGFIEVKNRNNEGDPELDMSKEAMDKLQDNIDKGNEKIKEEIKEKLTEWLKIAENNKDKELKQTDNDYRKQKAARDLLKHFEIAYFNKEKIEANEKAIKEAAENKDDDKEPPKELTREQAIENMAVSFTTKIKKQINSEADMLGESEEYYQKVREIIVAADNNAEPPPDSHNEAIRFKTFIYPFVALQVKIREQREKNGSELIDQYNLAIQSEREGEENALNNFLSNLGYENRELLNDHIKVRLDAGVENPTMYTYPGVTVEEGNITVTEFYNYAHGEATAKENLNNVIKEIRKALDNEGLTDEQIKDAYNLKVTEVNINTEDMVAVKNTTLLNSIPVEQLRVKDGNHQEEINKIFSNPSEEIKAILAKPEERFLKDGELQLLSMAQSPLVSFLLSRELSDNQEDYKKLEYNKNISAALNIAAEMFIYQQYSNLKPMGKWDNDKIAQRTGLERVSLTAKNALKNHGLSLTMATQSAKNMFASLLGLRKNYSGNFGDYNALISEAGNIIIHLAQKKLGDNLDITNMSVKDYERDVLGLPEDKVAKNEKKDAIVRFLTLKKDITPQTKESHEAHKEIGKWFTKQFEADTSSVDAPIILNEAEEDIVENLVNKLSKDIRVSNDDLNIGMNEANKKALVKRLGTLYALDIEAAKIALDYIEEIKRIKGEITDEEIKAMLVGDQDGAEAKNENIDREIEHFKEFVNELQTLESGVKANDEEQWEVAQQKVLLFHQFLSKNQRFFDKTATVSPMGEKHLVRWLVQPKDFENTYKVREGVGTDDIFKFDINDNYDDSKFANGEPKGRIEVEEGLKFTEEDTYKVQRAIAMAFGHGIDKSDPNTIREFANDVFKYVFGGREGIKNQSADDTNRRINEILDGLMTDGEFKITDPTNRKKTKQTLEIEHVGHAIQGITFLRGILGELQKGDKAEGFSSFITIESDAKTSGLIIKQHQLPLHFFGYDTDILEDPESEQYKQFTEWYGRGGTFIADENGEYPEHSGMGLGVKAAKDGEFLDAYQATAINATDVKLEYIREKIEEENKKRDKAKKTKKDPDIDTTEGGSGEKILNGLNEIIGPEKNAVLKVSKALREVFKTPLMIFAYGASLYRISMDVVPNEILNTTLNKVIEFKDFDEAKEDKGVGPLLEGVEIRSKDNFDKFKDYLTNRDSDHRKSKNGDFAKKEKKIFEIIRLSYGYKAQDFLGKQFGALLEAMTTTINATSVIFEVFKVKLDETLKQMGKEGVALTEKDVDDILEKLREYMPAIKGPLDKDEERTLALYTTKNGTYSEIDTRPKPQTMLSTKKQTTAPVVYRNLVRAAAAGVVLPIHALDGAIMAEVILEYQRGMINIHDAIMMNIKDSDDAERLYNQKFVELSIKYDWMKEVNTRLKEQIEKIEEESKKDKALNKSWNNKWVKMRYESVDEEFAASQIIELERLRKEGGSKAEDINEQVSLEDGEEDNVDFEISVNLRDLAAYIGEEMNDLYIDNARHRLAFWSFINKRGARFNNMVGSVGSVFEVKKGELSQVVEDWEELLRPDRYSEPISLEGAYGDETKAEEQEETNVETEEDSDEEAVDVETEEAVDVEEDIETENDNEEEAVDVEEDSETEEYSETEEDSDEEAVVVETEEERRNRKFLEDIPFSLEGTLASEQQGKVIDNETKMGLVDTLLKRWNIGKLNAEYSIDGLLPDDMANILPSYTQNKDTAKDNANSWNAYFDSQNNTIGLNLHKLKTAEEIESAFFHEVLGHYGLRKLFGKRFERSMYQLGNKLGGLEGLIEKGDELGIDLRQYINESIEAYTAQEKQQTIIKLTDELLAAIQDKTMTDNQKGVFNKIKTLVQEIVGKLRAWLQDRGLIKLSKLTDSDLLHLLAESRRVAQDTVLLPDNSRNTRNKIYSALTEAVINNKFGFKGWETKGGTIKATQLTNELVRLKKDGDLDTLGLTNEELDSTGIINILGELGDNLVTKQKIFDIIEYKQSQQTVDNINTEGASSFSLEGTLSSQTAEKDDPLIKELDDLSNNLGNLTIC